jgi:hypothetical protein
VIRSRSFVLVSLLLLLLFTVSVLFVLTFFFYIGLSVFWFLRHLFFSFCGFVYNELRC